MVVASQVWVKGVFLMSDASAFDLPEYARFASEVVRSIYLDIWFEDNTRWIRIDVLRDLVGNYGPYSIRIMTVSGEAGEFLGGEYPYCVGDSPEEVLKKCLKQLSEIAGIVQGLETMKAR